MKRWPLFACALLLAPAAQAQPQVRNYSASGNLESTIKLGCIAGSEAKASYNPVDLYLGARVCIETGQYDRAVDMFLLANVFGRFDMLRVADRSAHQGIMVARMQVFGDLTKEKTDQFQATAKATVEDKSKTAELCKRLRAMGPPTYHPRYMIQHGITAFTGRQGDGLVPDFAPEKAWEEVLATYVHCPAA